MSTFLLPNAPFSRGDAGEMQPGGQGGGRDARQWGFDAQGRAHSAEDGNRQAVVVAGRPHMQAARCRSRRTSGEGIRQAMPYLFLDAAMVRAAYRVAIDAISSFSRAAAGLLEDASATRSHTCRFPPSTTAASGPITSKSAPTGKSSAGLAPCRYSRASSQ